MIASGRTSLINKKIIHDFTIPLLLTIFVVLGIIWLTKLINIIELVSSKGVSAYKFFSLAVMVIPELIFYIIPFATIIAFYSFFQNYFFTREIYILRNIPVKPKVLLRPIEKVIIILILIEFANAFILAPHSYKAFDKLKFDIKFNFISVAINPGTIENVRNDLVSYVDHITDGSTLNDLFIYRYNRTQEEFLLSPKAHIVNNGKEMALNIRDGIVYRITPDKKINVIKFDYYNDNLSVVKSAQDENHIHYKEITLTDLLEDLSAVEHYSNEVYAGLLFKFIWIITPLFIFVIAKELYFYGEFRRNGLAKKHLLFWIVSIFIVAASFIIKTIAASNLVLAAFITLTLIFVIYLINNANFSNKI